MTPVFPTSYFPSTGYISELIRFNAVCMEQFENFPKQTIRNRCAILNSNGVQTLSIPLVQTHQKIETRHVKISFEQNWKMNHWRSIESAYNRSAYFEFYKDDLKEVFFSKEDTLLQFNSGILKWILDQLKISIAISYSEEFKKEPGAGNDFRTIDHALKIKAKGIWKRYPQVFSYRFDFVPNLSVLDLLFNCGPESKDFL